MKYEIEMDGRFDVNINYWSGKCKLSYCGMELTEEGKNTFLLGNEKCKIAGTLFSGVYLFRGENKVLIAKLHWYDYIICLIPFIVSMIGGIVGAVFGLVGFVLCYKIMPYVKNFFVRMIICIGIAAVVFGLILVLAKIFPSLFGISPPTE